MPVTTIRVSGFKTDNKTGETTPLQPSEALMLRGPVVEGNLVMSDTQQQALAGTGEPIASKTGLMMFDTGASHTCFDLTAAGEIGLVIVAKGNMTSASHQNQPMPLYAGKLAIPGADLNVEQAMGAHLAPQGLIALIGRDVMRHGTLFYNGMDGTVSFAI